MDDIKPNEPEFSARTDLSKLAEKVSMIKTEIGKKLIGQRKMVDLTIVGLLSEGHILLEGVPGVAKTFTAKLLAKVLDASFSRIQFTPDLMPSDVTGTSIFNNKKSDFEFKKGPIFNNIILIDEINRAPAKTQAALFECMEERQVTMDGTTYHLENPFIVMATQNPVEHEGTYKLPEAQLDRFLFKIDIHYPKIEEEVRILQGVSANQINNNFDDIKVVLKKEELLKLRETVKSTRIDSKLLHYIAQLVDNTRRNPDLYLGASPRASIGILNTSKAMAAIKGRDFVTPDDIRFVTLPVLSHRVVLTPEREMEGMTTGDVIKKIIEEIEIPR